MSTCIKIRGIYATALTKLMLDSGYCIVDPSSKIQKLFGLPEQVGDYDILIRDRPDFQGVDLTGPPEKMTQCLTFLQERLLDATLLEFAAVEEETGLVRAAVELPGGSKQVLDETRLTVTPTISKHHRLRIIASKAVEQAELTLMKHPDKRESLENDLFREEIVLPLEKAGFVRVEHIRPSGKPMRPREGVLVNADVGGFVFRRGFSKGRYDGLEVPIQEGDYGLTEITEGAWHIKHSYYTKEHKLIGEYFNVNTPVELYPYGARYLDLEVDVVCRNGEKPFLLDREKLALLCRNGCISSDLERKAVAVAEDLLLTLQA
jgi:probable ribonuclease FAU-1